MGKERPGLGSPFQISFPPPATAPARGYDEIDPLSPNPLSCADPTQLSARCTCVDCPSICPTLPYLAPPPDPHQPHCRIGSLSCLSFALIIAYSTLLLAVLFTYILNYTLKARQRRYERLALLSGDSNVLVEDPDEMPHATGLEGLAGVGGGRRGRDRSEGGEGGGERDSYPSRSGSSHMGLGRGTDLLDPIEALQPRKSKVNVVLKKAFYQLGLFCATRPCVYQSYYRSLTEI
jgi:Niemann-Pick C1 protein